MPEAAVFLGGSCEELDVLVLGAICRSRYAQGTTEYRLEIYPENSGVREVLSQVRYPPPHPHHGTLGTLGTLLFSP